MYLVSTYCPYCSAAINAIKGAGYGDRMYVVTASSTQRQQLSGEYYYSRAPLYYFKGL
jgi:hypothetical protein